jgi:hypothetical protein
MAGGFLFPPSPASPPGQSNRIFFHLDYFQLHKLNYPKKILILTAIIILVTLRAFFDDVNLHL